MPHYQPVRQAMFRPDGSITSVPTKLTENPQLERQLYLLDLPLFQATLADWRAQAENRPDRDSDPANACPDCHTQLTHAEGCVLCPACGWSKC